MSIRECERCSATTKVGDRCKRRTCIYANLCSTHVRTIKGLYLAKSQIPNSGMGLFTLREIKKGKKITDYSGTLRTTEQWEQDKNPYGVKISKDWVLDGASTQSSLGRYSNDCRTKNKRAKECKGNNSKISVYRRKASLKSTRNIKAGEEILTSYGASYWR